MPFKISPHPWAWFYAGKASGWEWRARSLTWASLLSHHRVLLFFLPFLVSLRLPQGWNCGREERSSSRAHVIQDCPVELALWGGLLYSFFNKGAWLSYCLQCVEMPLIPPSFKLFHRLCIWWPPPPWNHLTLSDSLVRQDFRVLLGKVAPAWVAHIRNTYLILSPSVCHTF